MTLFLIGEPFNPRPREWVGLAFFPFGVSIGMFIAWWREGVGAGISLASLFGLYVIYGWLMGSNVNTLWFVVFASPAFFFLAVWVLSMSNLSEVHA